MLIRHDRLAQAIVRRRHSVWANGADGVRCLTRAGPAGDGLRQNEIAWPSMSMVRFGFTFPMKSAYN
jgi:hypothetical protein